MGNGPFNVAKGRGVEFHNRVDSNDPGTSRFVIVLATGSASDATLQDFETLAAVLADANVTEANFTNYTRKFVTDADITFPGPDNANNRYDVTLPDQTWTAAGGTTDNTLTRLFVCYDASGSGPDSAIIPVGFNDFAVTTNGGDLTADFGAVYYRAS